MSSLTLGVVAQSSEELLQLTQRIAESGHRSILTRLVSDSCCLNELNTAEPQAWLLEIDEQDISPELADWLHQQHERDIPVLLVEAPLDSPEARQSWRQRLNKKLLHLPGMIAEAEARKLNQGKSLWPREIWLLLASTGGPEAVGEFLRNLPSGLDVAFVYVQHIDESFVDSLSKAVSRDSDYAVAMIEHGSLIQPSKVAVVSMERYTELLDNGSFVVQNLPWRGPYQPSMDQVLANFSLVAGNCNAIVFSGMGDDGARASRLLKRAGGKLWCQRPETCACPAMPEAVLALDSVDFVGSPKELAEQLSQLNRGHLLVNKLNHLTTDNSQARP